MPDWAVAYHFDIYLRGPGGTPFEEVLVTLRRHHRRPSARISPSVCRGAMGRWPCPRVPGAIRISGVVYDGAGVPVPDDMIETWQADPEGRFADLHGYGGASGSRAFAGLPGSATRGRRRQL